MWAPCRKTRGTHTNMPTCSFPAGPHRYMLDGGAPFRRDKSGAYVRVIRAWGGIGVGVGWFTPEHVGAGVLAGGRV